MKYKAFISYKHPKDDFGRVFVERFESAIKQYAKPLMKPPYRLFRDEVNMTPGANLSQLIRDGLADSEFLILLASPDAAKSTWVADEMRVWFEELKRSERKMIIVLTAGRIGVRHVGDKALVDWDNISALPPKLGEYLTGVPLWIDFSEIATEQDLAFENRVFKAGINRIVATLRKVNPETMLGVEVAQHRRIVRYRNGAVALLAALAIVATGAVWNARLAQQQADREQAETEALVLAADAEREFERAPQASLRKVLRAFESTERPLPGVERTLRQLVARADGTALGKLPGPVDTIVADGFTVVAAGGEAVFAWPIGYRDSIGKAIYLGRYVGRSRCGLLSLSGRFLALAAGDGVHVWEIDDGAISWHERIDIRDVARLEFDADDAWLAVHGRDKTTRFSFENRQVDTAANSGEIFAASYDEQQRSAQCGVAWAEINRGDTLRMREDDEAVSFERLAGDEPAPDGFRTFYDRYKWGGFSGDGLFAAVLSHEARNLLFWTNVEGYAQVPLNEVTAAAWYPALATLVLAYADHRIEARSIYRESMTQRFGHDAEVTHLFVAHGGDLVSGDVGGMVVLWQGSRTAWATDDGKPPRRGGSTRAIVEITPNEGPLVAFSPDGQHLARLADVGGKKAVIIDTLPNPLTLQRRGNESPFGPDERQQLLWTDDFDQRQLAPDWVRAAFVGWWSHHGGPEDSTGDEEKTTWSLDDAVNAAQWVLSPRRTMPEGAMTTLERYGLDRSVIGQTVYAGMRSADGRWLALSGSSDQFGIWHRKGDALELRASGDIEAFPVMRFSGDSRWFALGGDSGDVLLFNLNRWLGIRLGGHGNKVAAIAFSPEGDRLATAGANNALRVWDLNDDMAALPLNGMAFDYDGQVPIEDLAVSAESEWLIAVDIAWNSHGWPLGVDGLVQRAEQRIAKPLQVP